MITSILSDCFTWGYDYLKTGGEKFDLIYLDPPFNTGKTQTKGNSGYSYNDDIEDYPTFISEVANLSHLLLADTGSLFFHIDYREVHYCKVTLDKVFGRDNFRNEIIWAYDYGARSKTKWPTKHDNILWYTKSDTYRFNYDEMDRIPYMAPGLVGPEKAARGKTPTDVWWMTIVPTNGKEKTGYPTQKPERLLERIIKIHTGPGDLILDFFAGSGTTGAVALKLDRDCILVDKNPQAIEVMSRRF